MGILCELFVAEPEDAAFYEDRGDDESDDTFGIAQLGGLTSLQFELLWAAMERRPWAPATHREQLASAESWTFRFPAPFVALLAELEEGDIPEVAARWAQAKDMNCDPQLLEYAVSSLLELAHSVVESERGLYLWSSL